MAQFDAILEKSVSDDITLDQYLECTEDIDTIEILNGNIDDDEEYVDILDDDYGEEDV